MTADGFDPALHFVLTWEGGLTDDPYDPGGRTNKGITQSEYDTWRAYNGSEVRDVAQIDDQEVASIYRSDYWNRAHCDALPAHEDLLQFDTAVNMGPVRAIRLLQAAAGITVDGVFGSQTLTAVTAADYLPLVSDYCDRREAYYRALAARNTKLAKFLNGWLNRLNSVRVQLGILGAGAEPQYPGPAETPQAKIPDYGVDPDFDF
jgi:lysozyme family protein